MFRIVWINVGSFGLLRSSSEAIPASSSGVLNGSCRWEVRTAIPWVVGIGHVTAMIVIVSSRRGFGSLRIPSRSVR